jgi:hypothetical protein
MYVCYTILVDYYLTPVPAPCLMALPRCSVFESAVFTYRHTATRPWILACTNHVCLGAVDRRGHGPWTMDHAESRANAPETDGLGRGRRGRDGLAAGQPTCSIALTRRLSPLLLPRSSQGMLTIRYTRADSLSRRPSAMSAETKNGPRLQRRAAPRGGYFVAHVHIHIAIHPPPSSHSHRYCNRVDSTSTRLVVLVHLLDPPRSTAPGR